jgi:Outer membrane protein beta-barrel domain
MRSRTWTLIGLLCWIAAVPAGAAAQEEEGAQNLGDFFGALLGANWNVSAHGGYSDHGRFLLQEAAAGERALRGEGTWNFGAGAGVNFLPRAGARLGYSYASTDLEFRDDNGNGSAVPDVEGLGRLESHLATIEYVRTLFPADAAVTPFATAGFVASWWKLAPDSEILEPGGGGTEFRLGAIATLGLQVRVGSWFDVRLEAASTSVRNPFTGSDSFVANSGTKIDEPSRVGRTDFRLAVAYNFSRAGLPLARKDR